MRIQEHDSSSEDEESPSWQEKFVTAFEKYQDASDPRNNSACIGEYISYQLNTIKDPRLQSRVVPREWRVMKPLVKPMAVVVAALLLLQPSFLWRFWAWSGAFWQACYDRVLGACGNDGSLAYMYGTSVVGYFTYWVVGGLYTLADLSSSPHLLRRYKTQPGTNHPVPARPLIKCVVVVHVNQLVLGLPFVEACRRALVLRGADFSHTLPSLPLAMLHLAVFTLIEEVLFYYGHRLCHHRLLYKHIHKLHHEWQSPIAITAAYAHPLEHLFVNMAPIMVGPLLLGSHPAVVWVWVFLATLSVLLTHSGYHLPLLPSPQFHDFHHLKFTGCYGVLGVLDRLHGTDAQFRSTLAHHRDKMFFSLDPRPPITS
ncbi:Fatty acid hydroxylase domain-containing protein 2 [Chionoecetes opilio]|uniref:Fatty acid hydroxylase domain-containing protein 2 n=1 Tax=Chionoecetes opilio TaxID=41210 RepID=A0A8J5CXP3_CHIOP|nr:Fatty acid hydroxylase domain-containing protein 2 [Chionoecetes opilio]